MNGMYFNFAKLLVFISAGFMLTSGQDNGPTTETVTLPIPSLPLAPPGRRQPDLDVFANDAFLGDPPSGPAGIEASQDNGNTISPDTVPTTVMAVDMEQEVTLPTATEVITTTTEVIQTTTEPVATNLTTVASNFDPSFLMDSGKENSDLIILSETTTPDIGLTLINETTDNPGEPKIQPVVENPSTLVSENKDVNKSDSVIQESGNITDVLLDATGASDNLPLSDVPKQDASMAATSNESTTDVVPTRSTPSLDTTLTQSSVTDSVLNYETTVLTSSGTSGTTEFPKTSIRPTEGGARENITVVNESNLNKYLITKPKVSTSVDPITVDQNNINKYLTTKQSLTTKSPSEDLSMDSFDPPPPPPYNIINEGNTNNVPLQNQLNTAFQPRAKPFFPGGQMPTDEMALIMKYRNMNPTNTRNFVGVNIPDEQRFTATTTTTTQEPTPLEVAFDPDFDVSRALPPPPDPNATNPPSTTQKVSNETVVVGNNELNIPPPPLSGDGIPPPPSAFFREPNEQDYITTSTVTTTKSLPNIPPIPVQKTDTQINKYRVTSSDKTLQGTTKDQQERPADIYSTDVQSLFEKDKKFIVDFNSLDFRLPSAFFNSGNQLPGLPMISDTNSFSGSNKQSTALKPTSNNLVLKPTLDNLSFDKDVDIGRPPPIFIDESVDRRPKPPPIRQANEILSQSTFSQPIVNPGRPDVQDPPPIRQPNEVLSQRRAEQPVVKPVIPDRRPEQPYRTFRRTRVYFGSDKGVQQENPSFEQTFTNKLAQWGKTVRQNLEKIRTQKPPIPINFFTTTRSPQMFRIETRQKSSSIGQLSGINNELSNSIVNSKSLFENKSTANRRVFNYWKDSSSDKDAVRVVPNNQQIRPIVPNSQQPSPIVPNNRQPPPIFPNNQQPPPIVSNNRQPPPIVPNNQQPPPLVPSNQQPPSIAIAPSSGTSQNTRPIPIQPEGDIPTFLNSAMARRDTTRTAPSGNLEMRLPSNQSPNPRPDNSLTFFQLPNSERGLLNVPDAGPPYTRPEQQDSSAVVNPGIQDIQFEPTLDAPPKPILIDSPPTEVTTTTTPKTTTAAIPTTQTSPVTTQTTPMTTVTQKTTTPITLIMPNTQQVLASREQFLDVANLSNQTYETIDTSPAGLLAGGFSPTPIMVISEEKIDIAIDKTTSTRKIPITSPSVLSLSEETSIKSIVTGIMEETIPTSTESLRGANLNIPSESRNKDPLTQEKSPLLPPPIVVATTEEPTTTAKYIPVQNPPLPQKTPAFRNDIPTTTPVPLSTAERLTQEDIIKRLQRDSVLKSELPPEICHQCHYVNNVCFMSEAGICNRFVECVKLGGNVRAFEKECSLGNFWSPKSLACEKSYTVDCPSDPCKDSRLERHPYNGRCRAYWICTNSTSGIKCCPNNYRYSGIDKICVPDSTCSEPCDAPKDIVKAPPKECPWKAVPGKLLLFTDGYSTQSCAPGTRFDVVQCTCVKSNIIPEGEACKPDMLVDFEGGKSVAFRDKSGRMHGVGEENVVLRSGTGLFFGTGKLSFWRYANVELGPLLAIKIRFFPYGRSKKSVGLLSNCNGTPIGSTVDIRLNTWTNEITFKLSTNIKLHNRITLTYKPFVWNEAIFIYDGSSFSVASNEQTGQLFLEGSIPQQHPAIQVGGCNYKDGYRGYVDDIYIYNGCIPDDLDWVIFSR